MQGCFSFQGRSGKTLIEACKDEETLATLASHDRIFEKSAEKASKVTFLMTRRVNSQSRLEYYKKIGDKERLKTLKRVKVVVAQAF